MNRKRKTPATNTTEPPLSAFAAHKARKHEADQTIAIGGSRKLDIEANTPPSDQVYAFKDNSLDYDSEDGMHEEPLDNVSDKIETVRRDFGSWRPNNENYSRTEKTKRLKLFHGESLTIVGECNLTIVSGIVSIFGAILTPNHGYQRIVASTTEPLPMIRCLSHDGAAITLDHIQKEESFKSLAQLSPLFGGIWSDEEIKSFTFKLIYNSLQGSSKTWLLPFNLPLSWQKFSSKVTDNTSTANILVVCGPVNSGTPLFFKFLANSLTTGSKSKNKQRWAYIELDTNGSEWALPGHVALSELETPLLNSSFVRNGGISITEQHFVGTANVKLLDSTFLKCTEQLINTARKANINFIVHLPEWYQGSGLDMTMELCKLISPTDLIILCNDLNEENVQRVAQTASAQRSFLEAYDHQLTGSRTTAQLMDMAIISYFHGRSQIGTSLALTPISDWRPLCVSYAAEMCDFVGVFVHGQMPPLHAFQISTLLNGNLVSILQADSGSDLDDRSIAKGEGDAIPYFEPKATGWSQPFEPQSSRTIAVALVRSVDIERQQILIVLPHWFDRLPKDGIVLCVGGFKSPGWAYLEEAYHKRGGNIHLPLAEDALANLSYVSET